MLDTGSVDEIKIVLYESKSPSRKFSGTFR